MSVGPGDRVVKMACLLYTIALQLIAVDLSLVWVTHEISQALNTGRQVFVSVDLLLVYR